MYKFESEDGFKDFLLNIKEFFKSSEHSIHKARNELKIINYQDKNYVVKAFKIPNIINQFVYVYLRSSKAKKSYQNAIQLKQLNLPTPTPIGYIEFLEYGLLKESYFVSEYQKYDFLIREPFYEKDFPNREEIIKQFAYFTYSLHQKGVYHRDYSAGNTLVCDNKDGTYSFSVVDINRMQFKQIDMNLAMENFNKLWADEESLTIIAKSYAKLSGYDEKECIETIIKKDKELKSFVENRRKWKKRILRR